jgi:hypothetical protein
MVVPAFLFSNSKENASNSKIYLYCPYEYREKAKALGAKFDGVEKKWYVLNSSPHKEVLINTFHRDNFNYKNIMYDELLTLEEVKHRDNLQREFNLIQKDYYFKKFGGNEHDFGCWYSENFSKVDIRNILDYLNTFSKKV